MGALTVLPLLAVSFRLVRGQLTGLRFLRRVEDREELIAILDRLRIPRGSRHIDPRKGLQVTRPSIAAKPPST